MTSIIHCPAAVCITALLILCFSLWEAFSQSYPIERRDEFDKLIQLVIGRSIENNYAEAESAAVELSMEFPDSPAGHFFRAGVLSSMMVDYEEIIRESDFDSYLDEAARIAEAGIDGHPDDPWNHFYLGGAMGYYAFHHLRAGRLLQALTTGIKAIGELKRTLELDSTIYDAYMGLGNYKYWLSRRTEFLRWMPFISDRREEGIRMMFTAMEKGKYCRESAASTLAWALIDAGRYDEALELADSLLIKYPQSRFFLYIRARTLYDMGDYEKTVEAGQLILERARRAQINNHFNEVGILAKLAKSLVELERYDEAAIYCFDGLNLPLSDEVRKRKDKSIEILKECRTIILANNRGKKR